MKVKIKRVYEKPGKEDGTLILVDRLWHRGLTKEKAKVELKENEVQISALKEYLKKGAVTLVYGAKDEKNNEARVLEELLND